MIHRLLYTLRLRKKPQLQYNRDEVLNAYPLRNQLITWEEEESGEVSLVIPQKQKTWIMLLAKVFSIPDKRVVVLDEVGAFVWKLCDGKSTIDLVTRRLRNEYGLTHKEAETSLLTYLRQLAKKGLIGIAVPADNKKAKGGR